MAEEIIIQAQQRAWLQQSVLQSYVIFIVLGMLGLPGAFTFAASRTSLIG